MLDMQALTSSLARTAAVSLLFAWFTRISSLVSSSASSAILFWYALYSEISLKSLVQHGHFSLPYSLQKESSCENRNRQQRKNQWMQSLTIFFSRLTTLQIWSSFKTDPISLIWFEMNLITSAGEVFELISSSSTNSFCSRTNALI